MKLKKTEKLVVSKKMFASSKKKKDSDEKSPEKPKKKEKNISSPKKSTTPKKKKNASTSEPQTGRAEKGSLKSPSKAKTSKGADKNLSNISPSKSQAGASPEANKNIDWSKLGVQRCSGCGFTTDEEGIFSAHLSLCRLFNEHKIKSPTPSPSKKKQVKKSDTSLNSSEKTVSTTKKTVSIPEKQAVIQEPYLEGSSPAQTVFLFRCYHCRAYFINIQTLKDHHRMAHGTKNLTVSLVPFSDDEAPEDISKKIIVDGSRIVPQVNWRREMSVVPVNATVTVPYSADLPIGGKDSLYSCIPLQSVGRTNSNPLTVVGPKLPPTTSAPSEINTAKDVTIIKHPIQEVRVQVTSSSDKSDEKAGKKKTDVVQKNPKPTILSRPKLVPVSSSTVNPTANKMVVLNLIPKSQTVSCTPVQIGVPSTSSLNTCKQLTLTPSMTAVPSKLNQESSSNWNNSTKNKAILPKSILFSVRPPPVRDLPLVLPQTSKIGTSSDIAVTSTAQKVIQTTASQFINTSGLSAPVVSAAKQKNRKIILFPLTSNASSNGTLVAPVTALTATPVAAAITTSAIVTCATTTSPSIATPLPSSLARPTLQSTVSPLLISSAPTVIASNVSSVVPSVWVFPPQSSLTSVDAKLTLNQLETPSPNQCGVLTKTIHIKSPTTSPKAMTQPSPTTLPVTTQPASTVTQSSPLSSCKTSSVNSQSQLVTITPVSEAIPTIAGMSLLEKSHIIKTCSYSSKRMQVKPGLATSDTTIMKPDKPTEATGKCTAKKVETSSKSSKDDKTNSKSTQCILSSNNKRKTNPDSDTPPMTLSVSPKKKAHISSQTSTSKNSNPNNLESAPSLSTSTSKGVDTSEDFTVALLAKKKVPISTPCNSTIKNLLSGSSITTNTSPLVIVRKSVGSNKLVVHTMVSANKLFQLQGSNAVICSLCATKIKINSIRGHLYWHFHVENRNSSQCAKDSRCHYCSVIDYVISMIPKIKKPEKFEEISSQTSPKPLTGEQQLQSDITVVEESCLPVDSSTDCVDTEPLGLKISSTFSLQSEGNILRSEEQSQVLTNLEQKLKTVPESEPESEKEKESESQEDSSDLAETNLVKDDEVSEKINKESSTPVNPVMDVQNTDTTEDPEKADSGEEEEASCKVPSIPSKNFKLETPTQAEKNSIYKGNFYICGFKDCTFSSLCKEDFKAHQDNEHGEARGYSCVHCQLECLEAEMLVHHMDSHLCGEMFILYRCAFPECNFGTNLMKSFIDHNVETHSRETVFLCYYCNANFQGCTALHKHLRANLLKYVHCPHCSVRNGLRDVILTHIKSDHPDKPRRIFVTGQMVCHQKQKVLDRIASSDLESDSSDIDSDCMIVDDDILDRHLIKQTKFGVRDLFGKADGKESESLKGKTISEQKNSNESDSDCMIVEDEKVADPKGGQPDVSAKADNVQDDAGSKKLTKKLIKPPLLKKKAGPKFKQTDNVAKTVLNTSNFSKAKSSSEVSTNPISATTDKDGSESEESSVYFQVKKVTHTYSRQKENRLSSKQQQLEDSPKFDKDSSNEKSPQDSVALTRSCKRRLLIRNKPHGKGDIGTMRLDALVRPLYLLVDNEVHCRICTFKCVPLQKMHSHILLMHLNVFLYQCKVCHKKCSCKIEMTEHCEHHGKNNQGFAVLPEPDWDQVIRSCLPNTCKASSLKSPAAEKADTQTSPLSKKAKSTKTELASSPKTVSPGGKRKSLEVLDSAGCKISTKENSSKICSSSAKTSSNEDRNIFSLFSFSLESDTEMQYNEEDSEKSDTKNSSKRKFDSSFSNRLFTLPSLSNFDKTPVKNLPVQESPQRTPTPEGHDQITVGKEQYMRELHLISISEVSNCKHKNKSLSSVSMSSHLSKYQNTAMAKLRSWRTALERTSFSLVSKTSKAKTPKKTLPRRNMLITPKTLRKKVLSKTSKLKMKRVPNRRSSSEGHVLRSAFKLRHSPRTLKRRLETRESLLKTPQKYVTRKRPQSSKSPSSCLRAKSPQSASSKPKVSKPLAVNRKKVKNTPRKIVKSSVRTVVKKKNLTISYGKRSIKKALNRASRKSAVQAKARILNSKRTLCKRRPLHRISSSSLKSDTNKDVPVKTCKSNCLYFSCSWCQFRVSDREHFKRHISLHNFFPQGCKMHCPYCSYTTPSAVILEKHIPMHMDKHPFGCRHCGFSAKSKMMVVRHCKRSHPDIPVKLVNRSTSSQKLRPSWPVVSFSPKVRLKKCAVDDRPLTCLNSEDKSPKSKTKN